MNLNAATKAKARTLFSRGLSVPEVAQAMSGEQMFPVTEAEIHALQDVYAETLRKQAQNQRMILRTQMRDSVVPSVQVLKNILAKKLTEDKPVFQPGEEKLLRLKLEAARILLNVGAKFADDNLVNVFTEKPESDHTAEVSFDFVSTVRNDGATVLTPVARRGHLALYSGGTQSSEVEDLF